LIGAVTNTSIRSSFKAFVAATNDFIAYSPAFSLTPKFKSTPSFQTFKTLIFPEQFDPAYQFRVILSQIENFS
jgi:hypothetical protein